MWIGHVARIPATTWLGWLTRCLGWPFHSWCWSRVRHDLPSSCGTPQLHWSGLPSPWSLQSATAAKEREECGTLDTNTSSIVQPSWNWSKVLKWEGLASFQRVNHKAYIPWAVSTRRGSLIRGKFLLFLSSSPLPAKTWSSSRCHSWWWRPTCHHSYWQSPPTVGEYHA